MSEELKLDIQSTAIPADFQNAGISMASIETLKSPPTQTPTRIFRADDIVFKLAPPPIKDSTLLVERIRQSICTSPPYFALQNLHVLSQNTVSAEFTPECKNTNESTPISAAEAGRHLAILGSCAVSLSRGASQKEYFLATHAEYNWIGDKTSQAPLYAQATAFYKDRHSALAKANLFDSKTQKRLSTLTVEYQVLSSKLFEKLYKTHFSPTTYEPTPNLYQFTHQPDTLEFFEDGVTATFKPILPHQCAGHFTHYYALPIAGLMGALSDCAGEWLLKKMFKATYYVEYAKIHAQKLLFSGEGFKTQIKKVDSFGNTIFFVCKAFDKDGQLIGCMDLQCTR